MSAKTSSIVIRNSIGILLVLAWMALGGYLGLAGYTETVNSQELELALNEPAKPAPDGFVNEGERFRNPDHWRAQNNLIKDRKFYSHFYFFPVAIQPLIALMAFGLIGCSVRQVRDSLVDQMVFRLFDVITLPMLAIAIGVSVFALIHLLPEFKDENQTMVYFFFLSFAGGMFTKNFFQWLNTKLNIFQGNAGDAQGDAGDNGG